MDPVEAMSDLDWEDWDPSQGNFVHHMLAGSMAGIAEHTLMFPIDTIKTHVQCMRECPGNMKNSPGMRAIEGLRGQGPLRLWRGVGTMFMGCVPAHATYFSVLEACKANFGANGANHNVIGAALSGGIATIFHDVFMTPMDVIKQRLQLGYYHGIRDCVETIYRTEGFRSFYRSFPTTLFMNIPYGCIMVASNESVKRVIKPNGDHTTSSYLVSGSVAGAAASACTTPLDVIKTRLQTQALNVSKEAKTSSTSMNHSPFQSFTIFKRNGPKPQPAIFHSNAATRCTRYCSEKPEVKIQYRGFVDAAKQICAAEGWGGLFRGVFPRLLVNSPSVAISWTTYEMAKRWLNNNG
mmetsp:Transcript_14227/g.21045  ORF Transcript_14227/g.21045 Transcript_14227/m.21045 type:complete len:351 (+) Transcript_14227:184-1236(+)